MFPGAVYVFRCWPMEQPAPVWVRDTGDFAPVFAVSGMPLCFLDIHYSCLVKVMGAKRNRLCLFVFPGAVYVYRRWRAVRPAPLWVRGMGDPAPVPLYPWEPPRSFNRRNRHCRARCSFHSPPAGRFALRASAHWARASLRCPFPRWGPAGPPSPDLGGGGLRPSPGLRLSFRRCAFLQQKVTIIIVPVDGDHGVGWYFRPDNFQPVPMVCQALSVAKRLSSLPRSQEPASADRRRSGVQANPEARFRGGEAHAGRGQPQ